MILGFETKGRSIEEIDSSLKAPADWQVRRRPKLKLGGFGH